jgi:tetratricopeptide (TPR) repeat protein
MTDDLLQLAITDPPRATSEAERLIASSADPEDLAKAYQALSYVLRQRGDTDEAIATLRSATRHAARVDRQLLVDIRGTLATTLAVAGQPRAALRILDGTLADATGPMRARTYFRRAWVQNYMGRNTSALADMLRAREGLLGTGDSWEGRTLATLTFIQLALGQVHEAELSSLEAERIFRDLGHLEEAELSFHNLGRVAFARGDIPAALDVYSRISPNGLRDATFRLDAFSEECDVYLAAGLISDAARAFDRLEKELEVPDGLRGDLHLTSARVRLATGDYGAAVAAAIEAERAFRRQRRSWYALRARFLQVQGRYHLGEGASLSRSARAVASQLDDERADEAPTALILAGRVATGPTQRELWQRAADYRSQPGALLRAAAWLGVALDRDAASNRGGVLRACGRGFAALDEHRRTLGSSELRALATAHGRELAELALRNAAADGRTLLRWSERWRATALAEPPVTSNEGVLPELASLRDSGRRLAEARAAGDPTEHLETERARLERVVRADHHRRAGPREAGGMQLDVRRLVADVGDGCLVELVDVDGTLHVLVVHGGKVRRRVAGSVDIARQLADHARSALRRAARGRPYDPGDLGERLQETLLGSAADLIPDGPVVITPTGRLHAVPWSMLPTLSDRAFALVPSAAQWQRARAIPRPRRDNVLLLAAPGLGSGGAEVPKLARRYEAATMLRGKKATVDAALAGLDGAALAHVAAHGHFRQDSPLFSSLEMADGSLSVYELERLRRAPYRLVLSACESGVLAPVGADELLGLASALFSMGTAGLVCSIAEVNDDATAALMVDLHDHLAAHPKGGLAEALLAARRAARGDPTREATAAAFLALGI